MGLPCSCCRARAGRTAPSRSGTPRTARSSPRRCRSVGVAHRAEAAVSCADRRHCPGFPIGVHSIVTAEADDAISSDSSRLEHRRGIAPPSGRAHSTRPLPRVGDLRAWFALARALRQPARPSRPAITSRPVPGSGIIARRKPTSGCSSVESSTSSERRGEDARAVRLNDPPRFPRTRTGPDRSPRSTRRRSRPGRTCRRGSPSPCSCPLSRSESPTA